MKIVWNGLTLSKGNFLKTMHREFAENVYWRRKGDTEVPIGKLKKKDFNGWILLSGAIVKERNR
jgi:hypothetical protein